MAGLTARRFAPASTVMVTAAFWACRTVTAAASAAVRTTRDTIGLEVIKSLLKRSASAARAQRYQPQEPGALRYGANAIPAVFRNIRFTSKNARGHRLQSHSATNRFGTRAVS